MEDQSTMPVVADAPAAPAADVAPPEAPKVDADTSTPSAEDALDADLRKAFRNSKVVRDNGRFAPKDGKPEPADDGKAPAADAVKPEGAELKPEPAKPAVDAPQSWTQDMKTKFATVDPEVQKYIAQREQEAHTAISKLGQDRKAFEPYAKTINHHAKYIEAVGKPAPQLINELLTASRALDENPASTIKALADAYGVDLASLYDPNRPAPNPEVSELKAQIQNLQNRLQQQDDHRASLEHQERETRVSGYQQAIEKFTIDHPDISQVGEEFEVHLRKLHAKTPNAEFTTLLQQAYDAAIWANPTTRATLIEKQMAEKETARITEAKAAAAKAKQAGSINVSGEPRRPSTVDLDTDLRAIWRKRSA